MKLCSIRICIKNRIILVMGNIGSQTGHISQRTVLEDQWVQSFPRAQAPKLNHHNKVLPERDSRQKLRSTNNGEILQSGGTLTGRQHQIRYPVDNKNQQQLSEYRQNGVQPRSYLSNQRYSLHKLAHRSNHHIQNKQNIASQKVQRVPLFGSEPDLRYSSQIVSVEEEMKERRIRKKYKAPPPPNSRMNEKCLNDWEEHSSDNEYPLRKTRLFKTRAETKKNSSHVNNHEHSDKFEKNNKHDNSIISLSHENISNLRSHRFSLPKLQLSENVDFQKELKEATKRLRSTKPEQSCATNYDLMETKTKYDVKDKLKTLDPSKENMKKKFKQIIEVNNNIINNSMICVRGEPSGKESSTPELSPNLAPKNPTKDKPKTFYFGMDDPPANNYRNNHFYIEQKIANSSDSDISSDMDVDDNNTTNIGIDLQLRPILPKKQLNIPRFSPATAWKLLSTLETANATTRTTASDDIPLQVEERIEKYYRPPPPAIEIGPRSSHDKSGDSGISGDAGPAGYEDNADILIHTRNDTNDTLFLSRQEGISWTPQQDLEDDSSIEEINNLTDSQKTRRPLPHLNRPHVFSLSLPRDNHLAAYMIEKSNLQYTGLQKLKRSVSGVFSTLSSKKDLTQSNQEDSNNWFFSKSAPNSLNNGFNSLEHRNTHENEVVFSSSLGKTSRVMYLPENVSDNKSGFKTKEIREANKYKMSVYSKSCEDLNTDVKNFSRALKDPPKHLDYLGKSNKKGKKFTFQSTVRQIERRRMAEKLSREAEKKEKQRLRELEAMQKVEEEFQKKRAREKATIRQQLRLYCMDDGIQWSSLPPNLEMKTETAERQEPDGAFSSSPASSTSSPPPMTQSSVKQPVETFEKFESKVKAPATQELSEYRQIQRDYKEYRGNIKYSSDSRYPKQTTVHPQVTYNMPKAKGSSKGNGNYRKDFACGVKSTKSAGSSNSEDSKNNSPKMYHNKYAPITRF